MQKWQYEEEHPVGARPVLHLKNRHLAGALQGILLGGTERTAGAARVVCINVRLANRQNRVQRRSSCSTGLPREAGWTTVYRLESHRSLNREFETAVTSYADFICGDNSRPMRQGSQRLFEDAISRGKAVALIDRGHLL